MDIKFRCSDHKLSYSQQVIPDHLAVHLIITNATKTTFCHSLSCALMFSKEHVGMSHVTRTNEKAISVFETSDSRPYTYFIGE